MRIALFSPVWFPVPPDRYGGIEAVVHLLADGLVDAGADVTLFASGDSVTRAKLVSVFDVAPSERIGESFWELAHALSLLERINEFDVVHDHSGLVGLTLFGLTPCPLLHTVHGPLTGEPGDLYERACRVVPDAGLISLTHRQRAPLGNLNWVANIHNAVDASRFPATGKHGDALLFLGRMSPDKGAHIAIELARRSGRPLKIAAKCREPAEIAYFDEHIAPHLGAEIEYVGEVGHREKCSLLQESHALVAPILWEEPFGLAFVEALACGTPVVALSRGSVPELIRHGETGYIARDIDDMLTGIADVARLDPADLRRDAEQRFGIGLMVQRHLEAYLAAAEPRGITTLTPRAGRGARGRVPQRAATAAR